MAFTHAHPPAPAGSDVPRNEASPDAKAYYPLTLPAAGTALPEADKEKTTPLLFNPISIGGITFKNRIFAAPMCQYSCAGDGVPTSWHMVHLGGMAVRGPALVIAEATAILPNGRISPECPGMWNDAQRDAWAPIVDFIRGQGARAGIQLAHAGRKASTLAPWVNRSIYKPHLEDDIARACAGGWEDNLWAPSPLSYNDDSPTPLEMTLEDIEALKGAWRSSVRRCDEAGFDVVEIHSAHGYLLHEFLSPISNKRTDRYGGSLENRMRLPLEIYAITRENLSKDKAVFVRISATDNHPGGEYDPAGEYSSWGIDQSKILLVKAEQLGLGLLDASSSGVSPDQVIKVGPGYQVPLAEALKKSQRPGSTIKVSAVGLITSGNQAEEILQNGQADVVTIAREFLRHADLVLDWAKELDTLVAPPSQYEWAYTRTFKTAKLHSSAAPS